MSGLDALRAVRGLPRDVGPIDRAVLLAIVSYADASGAVYEPPPDPQTKAPPYTLTVATFARGAGLTDERSARAAIARLVGRGYLLATDVPGRPRRYAIASALWEGVIPSAPALSRPLPSDVPTPEDTPPTGHPSRAASPLPSDTPPMGGHPSRPVQLTPPVPCEGPLPSRAAHSVKYLDQDLDRDLEKKEGDARTALPPSVPLQLELSEPEQIPEAKSKGSTKAPKAPKPSPLAAWGEGISRVTEKPWVSTDHGAAQSLSTIVATYAPKGIAGEALTAWLADTAERFTRQADAFEQKQGFSPKRALKWFAGGSPTASTTPKPNGFARPTSNQKETMPHDAWKSARGPTRDAF